MGCAGLVMLNLFAIALSTSHSGIMDMKRNRRDMCANQKCLQVVCHSMATWLSHEAINNARNSSLR